MLEVEFGRTTEKSRPALYSYEISCEFIELRSAKNIGRSNLYRIYLFPQEIIP